MAYFRKTCLWIIINYVDRYGLHINSVVCDLIIFVGLEKIFKTIYMFLAFTNKNWHDLKQFS